MQRIILSLLVMSGAAAMFTVGATGAYFSDTETSTGNVFTAGELDLKIDNESYYNGNSCEFVDDEWIWQGNAAFPIVGTPCSTSWELDDLNDGQLTVHRFFDFTDVKPDDEGEDTISLHVQNDAWMCMELTLTGNDDVSTTEPEGLVDAADIENDLWDGELAQNIQMFWWADDGDNVYEEEEPTISGGVKTLLQLAPQASSWKVAIADAENNIWGLPDGTPVPAEDTQYIAKAWCLGTLTPAPLAQDGEKDSGPQDRGTGFLCDGTTLNNLTQTDSATLDISFSAIQARNNEDFMCTPPETFEACTNPTVAYADTVVTFDQGLRKNGTPVAGDRSDPNDVLGAPQSTGTPFDNPVVAGSFFSLGFDEGTDLTPLEGGSIVVEFADNVIVDGPGNDLRMWEVTGGTSYPVERLKIEVSQDGSTWFEVPPSVDRDAEADLATSGLAWAKYVRLTDVSIEAEFEATADGYDLDAFSALNCGVPLAQQP